MQYEEIAKLARGITEVTEDITELTRRVEELGGRLAFLTARHNRIAEPAAQERKELASRIEELEERTLTITDLFMEGDLALGKRIEQLERMLERLENPLLLEEEDYDE